MFAPLKPYDWTVSEGKVQILKSELSLPTPWLWLLVERYIFFTCAYLRQNKKQKEKRIMNQLSVGVIRFSSNFPFWIAFCTISLSETHSGSDSCCRSHMLQVEWTIWGMTVHKSQSLNLMYYTQGIMQFCFFIMHFSSDSSAFVFAPLYMFGILCKHNPIKAFKNSLHWLHIYIYWNIIGKCL